ncbi:hypothetical protein QC760_005414 [Botrytis cinerea]
MGDVTAPLYDTYPLFSEVDPDISRTDCVASAEGLEKTIVFVSWAEHGRLYGERRLTRYILPECIVRFGKVFGIYSSIFWLIKALLKLVWMEVGVVSPNTKL